MLETPYTQLDPSELNDHAIERGANYDHSEHDFVLAEETKINPSVWDADPEEVRRMSVEAAQLAKPSHVNPANFENEQPFEAVPFVEVYNIGALAEALTNKRREVLNLPPVQTHHSSARPSNVSAFTPPVDRPDFSYPSYDEPKAA